MKRISLQLILLISFSSCNKTPPTPDTQNKVEDTKNLEEVISEKALQPKSDSLTQNLKEKIVNIKEEVTENDKTITKPLVTEQKAASKKSKSIDNNKIETQKIEKEISKQEETKKPKRTLHEEWNTLTKNYVSANGKVNYKAFKANLSKLETYLKELENTPPQNDWSKNKKLAYWFNLYNASTVFLVASNYPVNTIKDINNGKPWDQKFIKSGTHLYSLNEIENTIVRPNYNEPRLHVAFNCAAVSCPNLLNEAFTATKLNSQLNSLSKKWINDTTKNRIIANEIQISKIFEWYKIDFSDGIISFINKYSSIQVTEETKVVYLEYNWKLND